MPAQTTQDVDQLRAIYLARAHRIRKHVQASLAVLAKMRRIARREHRDVWAELSYYVHPVPDEAIDGAALKGAFRDIAMQYQHGRCCYCRCWLPATAYARPIEHILPRRVYGHFALEFANLAVACVDCNLAKSDEVWGSIARETLRYPDAGAFSDMYHARYHFYDAHVRYIIIETNGVSVALYRGRTTQGKHLCRTLLERIASKRALLTNNPDLQASLHDIDRYRVATCDIAMPALDKLVAALDQRLTELTLD